MPSVHRTFKKFRENIIAVDVSVPTEKSAGLNFAGYDIAMFQVIPSGGANPNIEVLSWSPTAGTFISANPVAVKAGAGVDVPYEFTVSAYGRTFWVMVTGGAIGSVQIDAAGRLTGDIN